MSEILVGPCASAAPSTWRSRSWRCATYSWIRGCGVLDHVAVAGREPRQAQLLHAAQRLEVLGHVAARCGLTTENMPSSTVSPVKSTRSSSSRKQRWFGAWPGVWSTSSPNSVPSMTSPSPIARSMRDGRVLVEALAEGQHLGAGGLRQARGPGRVVGVRVGEQHPAHALLHRRADDGVDVALVVGTGIDHRDLVDADEVGVGARAGEGPRVGRDDAAHERRERAGHPGSEIGHVSRACRHVAVTGTV